MHFVSMPSWYRFHEPTVACGVCWERRQCTLVPVFWVFRRPPPGVGAETLERTRPPPPASAHFRKIRNTLPHLTNPARRRRTSEKLERTSATFVPDYQKNSFATAFIAFELINGKDSSAWEMVVLHSGLDPCRTPQTKIASQGSVLFFLFFDPVSSRRVSRFVECSVELLICEALLLHLCHSYRKLLPLIHDFFCFFAVF